MTDWLTPTEAAVVARRHVITIRRALESGELHGHQRIRRGRWQVARPAVEAWMTGTNSEAACGCRSIRLVKRSA